VTPLLRVSDLTVRYRLKGKETLAAEDVDLEIPAPGYTLGLVGESGSGKTTLGMSIMNSIERPGEIVTGQVLYQGKDVLTLRDEELRSYRWREVSMVYQAAMNSLNPLTSAEEHLAELFREHLRAPKSEAKDSADRLLAEVGIRPERMGGFPHEFSGGMRQRIVIAMALALKPKILIADEPTSALDVVVQRQVLGLLKREVVKNGLSLIFITHEIALLPEVVDNVAVMYRGKVVEKGPLSRVLDSPQHPYTEMLVNSLLSLDSTPEVLRGKAVSPDDLEDVKEGCRFAPRCRYAFDMCRIEEPKLLQTEEGRVVACHKYN
jgi:peptide/nickel transport system ATP-binding protein